MIIICEVLDLLVCVQQTYDEYKYTQIIRRRGIKEYVTEIVYIYVIIICLL